MKRNHVSILILRIVLGLVVGGSSLALAVHQLHSHGHLPLLLLGLVQLIAAMLLLISRTVQLGSISLIDAAAAFAVTNAGRRA